MPRDIAALPEIPDDLRVWRSPGSVDNLDPAPVCGFDLLGVDAAEMTVPACGIARSRDSQIGRWLAEEVRLGTALTPRPAPPP